MSDRSLWKLSIDLYAIAKELESQARSQRNCGNGEIAADVAKAAELAKLSGAASGSAGDAVRDKYEAK